MFRPTSPRRERILVFGPPGSGKSTAWQSIAEWLYKTTSPGLVHVADTDLAWEGQRPDDGHLDDAVVATTVFDYESIRDFIRKTTEEFTPGDWLVVDMIDKVWLYSQQHYFEQVFGKSLEDYWVEAKKMGINPGGEYGANWSVINKLNTAIMLSIQRYPGHVLACSPATEVRQPSRTGEGGDDKEILHLFGRLGVKPEGQKLLSHHFHTNLYFQEVPRVGYTYTTVKERGTGREKITGEVVSDFARSYLIKVGGWTLAGTASSDHAATVSEEELVSR